MAFVKNPSVYSLQCLTVDSITQLAFAYLLKGKLQPDLTRCLKTARRHLEAAINSSAVPADRKRIWRWQVQTTVASPTTWVGEMYDNSRRKQYGWVFQLLPGLTLFRSSPTSHPPSPTPHNYRILLSLPSIIWQSVERTEHRWTAQVCRCISQKPVYISCGIAGTLHDVVAGLLVIEAFKS